MPFTTIDTRNSFQMSPDKNDKGEKHSLLNPMKKQGSIESLDIGKVI